MNAPLHFGSYGRHQLDTLLFARETGAEYGVPGGLELEPEPERVSDWRQVHEQVVRLGAARAAHERELCRWLLAAERLAVAARAGYASLREYAKRVVGLGGRQAEERLRVGRALVQLPALDEALAGGQLCFSAVRELTRVAEPETEQAWREWAEHKTARQVERAVATRQPGDGPDDRGDPSRLEHRLRFEVRAETMAMFRDLQAAVRAELGGEPDDDALLYEIARRALGGPDDDGRASYQVAVVRCDACQQVSIEADGERIVVHDTLGDMTDCDSQQLGKVDGPHAGAMEAAGPAGAAGAQRTERASQAVPPATRRRVLRRDGKRCQVDGCTNTRFLDVHHVLPRGEGGGHGPNQIVTLCGSHHRKVHAGRLCVDGSASEGFRFRHVDGRPYGQRLGAADLDVAQQAFDALTKMGFKLTHARQLLDVAQKAGASGSVQELLRAALRAS